MLSFRLRGQVNESLRSTAVIFETPSSLQHMKQSWRKSNDRLYGRSVEIHPSVSSSSGKVVVHNAAHTSSRSSCWPFTGQTSVRHTFSENTSLSSTPCSEAQSWCFPFAKLGKSTTPSRKNSMLRFRADSLKCATARSRSMQSSNPRCNPMARRHHSLRRGRHRRTNSRAHGWSAWAICDSSLVIIGSAANMDGAVSQFVSPFRQLKAFAKYKSTKALNTTRHSEKHSRTMDYEPASHFRNEKRSARKVSRR